MSRVRALVVHNRYRSAQPSGENVSVDAEVRFLEEHDCTIERFEFDSDCIATWPRMRRLALPGIVVWSRQAQRSLQRTIDRCRPDVIHIHNTFPLLSPSVLWTAHSSDLPVVQTLRNFRPICPAGDLLRDGHVCEECVGRLQLPAIHHGCYRQSRVASLPVATANALHERIGTWRTCVDIFVFPSSFCRAKYVEAGWNGDNLMVKHNAIAKPAIPRASKPAGFICVARLTEEKGVKVLLAAWKKAQFDNSEMLHIVGSGDSADSLKAMVADVPSVIFHGQLSHERAMSLIASCRAVVIPSVCYETFSRVAAEAFSLGTPAVASRIGALAEFVVHDQNGLFVKPGDADGLASALTSIRRSDELTNRLGAGAAATFAENFDPAKTTARLLTIYEMARARRASRGVTT